MTKVADILRTKGNATVHSVKPDDSMLTALQQMAEHEIGALLVIQERAIAGIVSERDYARKIALKGRNSLDTPVREIMTAHVHCVGPDNTSDECMALMTQLKIRHLPVVGADHELLGLSSIGDLIKTTMADQQVTIAHLEHYISGAHR